jgi:hypothetical protein
MMRALYTGSRWRKVEDLDEEHHRPGRGLDDTRSNQSQDGLILVPARREKRRNGKKRTSARETLEKLRARASLLLLLA